MRMVGHTTRYGVQRGVGVCSVLRNMCSLCRKGRAGSLVSGSQPLCPPKIGVTSPQGGGGMPNGMVKTENGKLIAHPLAAHLYRPLRPSGTSPNLEEESGCEPTFMFQSFKFHVSIHFVPLSQGDEEQSSGGGMFPRSPLIRSSLFFATYPLRFARPPILEGQS